MSFTKTWSETAPAGGDDAANGDNEIRDFKFAIRERLAVDHYAYDDESGHSDVGYHKQVTMPAQSTPTTISGALRLYAKSVSSVEELHLLDDAGNERQWSKDGLINAASLKIASEVRGDVLIRGASGWIRLGIGASGRYLRSDGTDPSWSAIQAGDITSAILPSGVCLQSVNTQDGGVATGTTQIPTDDTIPQNTEGDQYLSRTITPGNSSNKLKITVVMHVYNSTANGSMTVALFQDSVASALAAMSRKTGDSQVWNGPVVFVHYMTAGTTSEITFKVRAGVNVSGGTLTFNGVAGARLMGGVMASSITVEEIKA